MDDTDTPEPRGWFLSGDELAATRAKLDTLTRRAAGKGFSGSIDLTAVPATRTQPVPGGIPVTVHGFEVTITGEPPRYAGWRFVAAVDAVDGGTIIRYPPGADAVVRNEDVVAGQCDHCHTHRPRRSTVLVANDDTGQLLQVGRTCLKDFLGHHITPVFLTEDDIRAQLRASGSGAPGAWDMRSVLTYTWAAVQALGWTPGSAAEQGKTPTRDVVRQILTQQHGPDQLLRLLAPHLDEGQRQAPMILDALLGGLNGTSGYEANLTAILRGEAVAGRHLGLAVSAIPAYQRLQAQTRAVREQGNRTVDYVGVVGGKVTLSGTVRSAARVDGYTVHSPDQVLLVVDCGTAVAKMVTSAAWAYQVKVGDPLTVAGTVKAHSEWNGTKQTVLTRPKTIDTPHDALPETAPQRERVVCERVESPSLDGAAATRRTLDRTPTPSVAVSR